MTKFNVPANENYCATIVKLGNLVPLKGCDKIQGTWIFGNQVIVGINSKVGDVGVYFTSETALHPVFAAGNSLYRNSELNLNKEVKGYLEETGRIKNIKFRGHQSCGLFMPLSSFACYGVDEKYFEVGDTFDILNDIEVCHKYILPVKGEAKTVGKPKVKKTPKLSKLLNNQFRFHPATPELGKNIHQIDQDSIISITKKMHGTSAVISNILCKKKLNFFYKALKKLKIKVIDTIYSNIYSSRTVIKNDDLNKTQNHFYDTDIWGLANRRLVEFLVDGLTIYAEIVGHTPTGAFIQSGYDYGCDPGDFSTYIYRITFTNPQGIVFEFSAKQVQDWCKERGLKVVPELYYGRAADVFKWDNGSCLNYKNYEPEHSFEDNFLDYLKDTYLEKDCNMCRNDVPDEGIVVRVEGNGLNALKLKSFRFKLRETELLDKGEVNLEDNPEEENTAENSAE